MRGATSDFGVRERVRERVRSSGVPESGFGGVTQSG